jgi:hypothetical protein
LVTFYKSELHKTGSKYFEIKNYKLKELEKWWLQIENKK